MWMERSERARRLLAVVAIAAAIIAGGAGAGAGAHSHAVSDAVLRASGDLPAAKTEKTVKAEKELEKLTAKEKQIKERISEATINRARLLAQKRAELKQIRQKREEPINKEIARLKEKKAGQTALIRELKSQLTAAKKNKSKFTISALEISIALAESRLDDVNADLKKANDRLTKSYNDYKALYDKFTNQDEALRKILDLNAETEKKIKRQKEDFNGTKGEFNQSVRNKDFLTAERRMDSLVFIQTGINDNYAEIVEIKLKVKSDYYEQIVNYRI
jgi:chromosome segregation ATPase